MEPPVAICSGALVIERVLCRGVWHLQFSGDEFLYDVSRLGVENPEECLVGKAWYLLSYAVDVVNGVAFR